MFDMKAVKIDGLDILNVYDQSKAKDSIANLLDHLMNERECIDEDGWKAMRKELTAIVRESVDFAENAPDPDPSELFTDVYVNPEPNLSPTANYAHGEKNPLL